MKGTLKIVTLFNIPVFLHWSFPFIFLWILFLGYQVGSGVEGIAILTVFFLLIFVCVVLHEFGHALTARRYGVNTQDIILSPLGGIARLERIPDRPIEEFIVAIAGPAVNVVIALLLLPLIYYLRRDGFDLVGDDLEVISQWGNLGPLILATNVALVIFNMVPAFPMDGGRVLRSLLAMTMSRVKATKIAYIVAQFCAAAFFIYGLYSMNYILCFIAVFVVVTSRFEWKNVKRAAHLENKTARDLMKSNQTKFYLDETIQHVMDTSTGSENYFLVFNRNERIAGVLFHEFIRHAKTVHDLDAPIEKYRSHTWEAVSIDLPLEQLISLFQKKGYGIVPVYETGELVGQVDINTLNQFVRGV